MTPRSRIVLVGITVVAIGIGGVAIGRATAPARTETTSGKTQQTPGMAGMEGMNMTGGGSAILTPDQIRQFGVTFGSVEVRTLTDKVRASGVVAIEEPAVTQVTPRFSGFVERLHVDVTGQPVRRGDPLLEVYSPDLLATQQELLLAGKLQRDVGRGAVPGIRIGTTDLVDAARGRLRLWGISEAQIDDVIQSGRPRRALTLYAPASGIVVAKRVVDGQAFQPGDSLYTIADLSRVWIDVQLRETDAAIARVGSRAEVELAAFPGRPLTGRVAYVYPTLDSVSRSVRARISVANARGSLKPGMYVSVRLATPTRSALTVPNTAILRTGERNIVFVDMGRGQLMPHDVELGRSAADFTEVLSGLEPGQRVVTSAQFLLDSESNLAEVMRAMMGQMSSGDMGRMPMSGER